MTIGVISPSHTFSEIIHDVSSTANVSLAVKQAALQRGLYHAKNLIRDDQVKIFVARGATADLLVQKLDTPVIKVKITSFDLLEAFQKAKQISNRIVFIDHVENEKLYNLSFLEEILSIHIILCQYEDEEDISDHIAALALSDKSANIVGTAQCVENTARHYGLPCTIVQSSREAIGEALDRAQEMLLLYEREKLRQQHLETIISYAFDGVIATDRQGQITVFNELAEKAVGIKAKELIGKFLGKIQYPFLKKLYGDGSESTRTIVSLGNNNYVVNRIPIEPASESIVITFQEINKVAQFNSHIRSELYTRHFYAKYTFDDIVSQSAIMKHTIDIAKKYSITNSNILIIGESGTGKELFAQSIHNESKRKNGPFIAINCAALPQNLLETELFGYEEGAFTGAKKGGKLGLFEMAHEGTLFLDEIGELPLALQSRLLRVLQEKEVMRVGGEKIIPINVRIIAATNKNLRESIRTNDFRSDLYFRLNILQITLPALRERKEDILPLIKHFQQKFNIPDVSQDKETLDILLSYDWPGNIRELENVMERLIAIDGLSSPEIKKLIFQDQLFDNSVDTHSDTTRLQLQIGSLEEMEQQIIRELHKRFNGNKQMLSDILGISRTTLWKKLKEVDAD